MKTIRQKVKKKAFIAALENTLGVVSAAAEKSEIDRRRHYEWMKEDRYYAAEVENISAMALDYAGSQLHIAIRKGNITAIIFFLKCKGKGRGYIERDDTNEDSRHVNQFILNIRPPTIEGTRR